MSNKNTIQFNEETKVSKKQENNAPEILLENLEKTGKRIKALRLQGGYTQEELEKEFYIPNKTITKYETGDRNLPVDIAVRYAETFDVTLDYIYLGKKTTEPQLEKLRANMTPDNICFLCEILLYISRQIGD